MRRVVITGMSGFSPLGCSLDEVITAMERGESGVKEVVEWREYTGLRSVLGAPVRGWNVPAHFDRKVLRSMGRVAQLATHSAEVALEMAGLRGDPIITGGRTGVTYGSCLGGPEALTTLAGQCRDRSFLGLSPSSFLQMMSHSCSANIALYFGITGRQLPTCSACTSGSQAIGLGYEFIRAGLQDVMVTGGAEELCIGLAALFNSMGALSRRVGGAPLPFDRERDGIVVGEGAGTLVLESLEHAKARGAPIFGEILGFGMNTDGRHMTNPDPAQMEKAMRLAISSASEPYTPDVVHAHATGTPLGDAAEGKAIRIVFGDEVPVTALKSYWGHTLGACGVLEAWVLLGLMQRGWIPPIRNLRDADPEIAGLYLSCDAGLHREIKTGLINTFAFGGVNTSLLLGRYEG